MVTTLSWPVMDEWAYTARVPAPFMLRVTLALMANASVFPLAPVVPLPRKRPPASRRPLKIVTWSMPDWPAGAPGSNATPLMMVSPTGSRSPDLGLSTRSTGWVPVAPVTAAGAAGAGAAGGAAAGQPELGGASAAGATAEVV